MTIKKIVLGASLLVAGNAVAQDRTYTVKEGDTLSEIASKFGVKTKAVLAANKLTNADKLKLGQTLRIPAASAANKTSVKDRSSEGHGGYVVRQGDNDELIAKRLGITSKSLRIANPGVKWTQIQPGQTLNVPGQKGWFAKVVHGTPHTAPVKVASNTPAKKTVARTYKVQSGDNDWIIAKKLGTKPSVLRSLNPDIKWTALQIGANIRVPGTSVVASNKASNVKTIRGRYAVVTGDSVTLRRGPGTDHDIVTRVDKGTRVTVLDREGAWYKLRFPRGTEAWVRGDFLASTSAPKSSSVVASNNGASRSSGRLTRSRHETTTKTKVARSGSTRSVSGNPVIARAQSMLGVRYRYGAASRGSTDCSGLTLQAYRAAGISLPRTALEQSRVGKAVSKGDLKPGDLVFFKTNRGIRVNHAGIYIGGGKFIHASSGRGHVMVSSLDEGYYQRRYAGGRHVANFGKKSKETKKVEKKEEVAKTEPSKPDSTPVDPPAGDDK